MKKQTIITCLFISFVCTVNAQNRILKGKQPTMTQIMLVQIPVHPADTGLTFRHFEHLPVKHFPYFIADERQRFYSIAQRDSIIRKVDEMFFEPEGR